MLAFSHSTLHNLSLTLLHFSANPVDSNVRKAVQCSRQVQLRCEVHYKLSENISVEYFLGFSVHSLRITGCIVGLRNPNIWRYIFPNCSYWLQYTQMFNVLTLWLCQLTSDLWYIDIIDFIWTDTMTQGLNCLWLMINRM